MEDQPTDLTEYRTLKERAAANLAKVSLLRLSEEQFDFSGEGEAEPPDTAA